LADLVVLHKTPNDAAAFDKCYFENHIPLAKKLPGLRKYRVTKGPVATQGGPSNLHLIAGAELRQYGGDQGGLSPALKERLPRRTCRNSQPRGVEMHFSERPRCDGGDSEGLAATSPAFWTVTPSALGCEECLESGSRWLHLRICRTCGPVGCCDDSPNKARYHRAFSRNRPSGDRRLRSAGRLGLVLRRQGGAQSVKK